MTDELHGGTVKMPVKPDAKEFSSLLAKGLGGQAGEFLRIGKSMGLKLLAGFALVEIGVKVAEEIGQSIDAAKNAEAATAQLQQTVKNAGFAYKDYADQVESAQKAGRKFGFTNTETTSALSQLTLGLKDPALALKVLGVAQDLAVAKHMDLNSAALLVTKGMEGQIRPLKQLGIDLPVYVGNAQAVALAQEKVAKAQDKVNAVLVEYPHAVDAGAAGHQKYLTALGNLNTAQDELNGKSSAGEQILKALSDRLGGSASTQADTYAGKQRALNAGFDDIKEKIGKSLLPILGQLVDFGNNTVVPAFEAGIKWVGKYADILGPAAVAVGVLSGAAFILDVALDANPIGLVVLGIEALIAVFAVLSTNMFGITQQFSDFEYGIWGTALGIEKSIVDLISGMVNTVIDGLNVLLGPINAIRSALHLGPIQIGHVDLGAGLGAAQAAVGSIKNFADSNLYAPGGGYATSGSPSGAHASNNVKAMGGGGTVLPTPGGTIVRMSEAGRSETVVDTESLNRAMDQPRGVQVIQYITASDPMVGADQAAQRAKSALVLVR